MCLCEACTLSSVHVSTSTCHAYRLTSQLNLSRASPPCQALENRTLDSKREMDILSALDEMKSLKVCKLCALCS